MGKRRMVVGGDQSQRHALAVGQQTVARRLPDRAPEGHLEEEQVVAAAQGAGHLPGGRRCPELVQGVGAPIRTGRADRPYPGTRAEPARRGHRRPRHRQSRTRQFTVRQRRVAHAHGPVGRAHRTSRAAGCHVRHLEQTALGVGGPGDRARVSARRQHRLGEEAVQPKRAVRAVRLPYAAAQFGQLGAHGVRDAVGRRQDLAQRGDEIGEAVRRVGGTGRAECGDHRDGRGRGSGESASRAVCAARSSSAWSTAPEPSVPASRTAAAASCTARAAAHCSAVAARRSPARAPPSRPPPR